MSEDGKLFTKPSRVRRDMQEDCDINKIMGRWRKTGLMPQATRTPRYGDFSNAMQYQDALNRVMAAKEDFMALPARVRARVDNDPGRFLDFISNTDNLEELVELGLVEAQLPQTEEPEGETPPETPD